MNEDQIKAIVTEAIANATKEYAAEITKLKATVERQEDALRTRDMREVAATEVAKFKNLGERARKRVLDLSTAHEAPLTEAGALDVDKIKESVQKHAKEELEYITAESGEHNNGSVHDLGESQPVTLEQATEGLLEAAKGLGMTEAEAKVFAGIR